MKTKLTILALLITVGTTVHAQVAPDATMGAAHLQYVFRYSENAYFYTRGDRQTISPSASVSYINAEERHPFIMKYSGGYTWNIAGPAYSTGLFQRLSLSQALEWRKWGINLNDNVAYLPETPITGFSGIVGIGEPIGQPNPNPPTGQSILALNTHVVSNQGYGEAYRGFAHAMSLSGGAGYDMLRYPDGSGLATDTLTANGNFSRDFNPRNRILSNFKFARYSYPGYINTFASDAVTAGFRRQWNHSITTNMMIGPEWITSPSSSTGSTKNSTIPSSTRISASASIDYRLRFGDMGLNYNHGTNGGAGYLLGASYDAARINYSRQFARDITVGFDAAYNRTSGLSHNGVTNAKFAGAQVSWQVGEHVTAFANYTFVDQTSSSALSTSALSGLEQLVSFGMSYSPRRTRIVTH
jgi:hypothetical protein